MQLDNLAFEEIGPFCNSLTVEKKYVTQPHEMALRAEFVTGVRINGELAGIGGLSRYYLLFPVSFYIVKAEFQRKGVGSQLMKNIIAYAAGMGYNYILSTINTENTPAVIMHLRGGYKTLYESGNEYRMGLPLNRKGRIVCKFLPLIFSIGFPVRGALRWLTGRSCNES
jgi:GNAT superfamily N-acetyltransferase